MLRLLPVLILLIMIAAIMRDDFALTLVYLFIAAAAGGSWWSSRSLAQVEPRRTTGTHAFLGEQVRVRLNFTNRGWLPVLWLNVQDELPVALSTSPNYSHVTSLTPGARASLTYALEARKRGFYAIGPLKLSTGDILGLHSARTRIIPASHLTVYPKIIPLSEVRIPSRSPQGTLRHHQPVFEDPTRIFSKREYTSGDSLRRVDWKTTAVTGRLHVKLFEPSISLDTFLFLDLDTQAYPSRRRIDSSELAIVICASLANWVSARRQATGLWVNGQDPLAGGHAPLFHPMARGQAHLMRMLETLARVETTETGPLEDLIHRERFNLPWGTSLIAITGQVNKSLLDELYQARRSGLETLLILAGMTVYDAEIERRAAHFGIALVRIAGERDLDLWRR